MSGVKVVRDARLTDDQALACTAVPSRIVVAGSGRASSQLVAHLAEAGYETRLAAARHAATRHVVRGWPDLVVLCIPLSDDEGATVVGSVRASYCGPILVIGPARKPESAVAILDAGADDYVSDRVTPPELLARVRARLRRTSPRHNPTATARVTSRVLCLDQEHLTASYGDHWIRLSRREMTILRLLAIRPGAVLESRDLAAEVWGDAGRSEVQILRTYIKFLRRKLEHLTGRCQAFWLRQAAHRPISSR